MSLSWLICATVVRALCYYHPWQSLTRGRGSVWEEGSMIPVGVREIFPTASSMINRLARAASLSLLSLRPLLVHTCCSGKESDGMTTHFKQAIFPGSVHFLFWMLSAVCDVTKGSKVLSKFSNNTWAEVPQDWNKSYSIMCLAGGGCVY